MAVLTPSVVAEMVRASRQSQGFPDFVGDAGTLQRVAQLLLLSPEPEIASPRKRTSRGFQSAARSHSEVRRVRVDPR